jgi:hypothetical protein
VGGVTSSWFIGWSTFVGIWWVVLAAAFADDEACSSFICLTFSDTLVLLAVPGAIVWSLGLIVLYIARRPRRRSARDGQDHCGE